MLIIYHFAMHKRTAERKSVLLFKKSDRSKDK